MTGRALRNIAIYSIPAVVGIIASPKIGIGWSLAIWVLGQWGLLAFHYLWYKEKEKP